MSDRWRFACEQSQPSVSCTPVGLSSSAALYDTMEQNAHTVLTNTASSSRWFITINYTRYEHC